MGLYFVFQEEVDNKIVNFSEFAVSILGSQVVVFSLIGLVFLSSIDTPILPYILKAYQFSIKTTIAIFDITYTIISTVIWATLELLRIIFKTTYKVLKFIFGPYVLGNIITFIKTTTNFTFAVMTITLDLFWSMTKFGYKGFSWILKFSLDIFTIIFQYSWFFFNRFIDVLIILPFNVVIALI